VSGELDSDERVENTKSDFKSEVYFTVLDIVSGKLPDTFENIYPHVKLTQCQNLSAFVFVQILSCVIYNAGDIGVGATAA